VLSWFHRSWYIVSHVIFPLPERFLIAYRGEKRYSRGHEILFPRSPTEEPKSLWPMARLATCHCGPLWDRLVSRAVTPASPPTGDIMPGPHAGGRKAILVLRKAVSGSATGNAERRRLRHLLSASCTPPTSVSTAFAACPLEISASFAILPRNFISFYH
jgi:hypothetical protein